MSTKIVLALLGGAAVGVAVGVLLAPDAGDQTRAKLREQASDLADRFLTLVDQVLLEVEKRTEKAE